MALKFKSDIVWSGCHGKISPSYFVIHETAGPGAPAVNLISWWKRGGGLPVHYILDWHDICYQCVPDDQLAWHVGGGNAYTFGVELCHATNQADFEKVWNSGVELAALKLTERGWGIDRLLSHYECGLRWGGTDHTDPHGYFEEFGRSWEEFKQDVEKKMKGQSDKEELKMTLEEIKMAIWSFKGAWKDFGGKVRANTKDNNQLLNQAARPWSYKNPALEKEDTYQILRNIRDGVVRLEDKLDEAVKKLGQ